MEMPIDSATCRDCGKTVLSEEEWHKFDQFLAAESEMGGYEFDHLVYDRDRQDVCYC